jgi:hypothetical protein
LDTRILVSKEANQLAIIVSDCFAFSSDFQNQCLNAVGQYIKYVTQDEWETMRWGNPSLLAQNAMQNIFHVVQSYTPQGEKEKVFYEELVVHLNLALDNRRLRLDSVSSILIGPLRFILVLGAIFISFFVSLLRIKNTYLHWFVLMVVSFVLSFNISLALMIDFPFSGEITISTAPYEEGNLSRFKQGVPK